MIMGSNGTVMSTRSTARVGAKPSNADQIPNFFQ